MSLENDINQAKFKSEHQKSLINIIYTHNWIREKLQDIFDKEELTPQQFNILRILRGSITPLSTLQIRERMLDKMSDTSRIVDRLVIKGLAKKAVNKSDKRLVDVSISDKGKKVLQNIDKFETDMEGITKNLTAVEAKTLNQLLDKIRNSK